MKKLLFVSSSAKDKLNVMYEAIVDSKLCSVDIIYNGEIHSNYYTNSKSFLQKLFEKLKIPIDKYDLNNKILNYCEKNEIDLIFFVKGNNIKPSTLKKLKKLNIQLISWSQDDMYAFHNRSWYYTFGLKYYDLVVTQKSYNVNELSKLGAKRILFQNKSFLPRVHKSCEDCRQFKNKHDVLFIGSAEKERYESLLFLAKKGIEVNIYGSGWDRLEYQKNNPKELVFHFKNLLNDDYANTISCSKISLCFLRKLNRDLQTSRTVEIPACGGFMLAERTDEQLNLFKEGKEAEYFSSNSELYNKTRFYLDNPQKRQKISKQGQIRCVNSNYNYQSRAKEIINFFK